MLGNPSISFGVAASSASGGRRSINSSKSSPDNFELENDTVDQSISCVHLQSKRNSWIMNTLAMVDADIYVVSYVCIELSLPFK